MTTYTTLNKIPAHFLHEDSWDALLHHLGKTQSDDEPLALTTILDSNGLRTALVCLRACEGIDREARLYAVWCARQVQHLMTDKRLLAVLDVAERYANGGAELEELDAASDVARYAARDAASAVEDAVWGSAAWYAASAASDAARAAMGAACDVAFDAALYAASAATDAAKKEAWDAAGAAWYAAKIASLEAQTAEFRRVFG